MESLIMAGAFDSLVPNRRVLLWQLPAMLARAQAACVQPSPETPGLFAPADVDGGAQVPAAAVEEFSAFEKLTLELYAMGFSPDKHVMGFLRPGLRAMGALDTQEAGRLRRATVARVGGLVIRPHRPPTRSGRTVVFFTLEDEAGLLDVTVFEPVYQRFGHHIFTRPALLVEGVVERRGETPSLTARKIRPLDLAPPASLTR